MSQPYNILLVTTDQQRDDHVGWSPDARMDTPNLDALAEGCAFRRCVTVNPICMPARCALVTGKYTRQIGAVSMSGELSLEHPTFLRSLQSAGYRTIGVGKFHFWQGWPWEAPRGAGHDLVDGRSKMQAYGFDELWEVSGKQLAYRNYCEYAALLERRGLLGEYRDWIDHCGPNNPDAEESPVTAHAWPFPEELYIDRAIGAEGLARLEGLPADKPFFMHLSFCGPHQPFDPPASALEKRKGAPSHDFIPGPKPLSPETKERLAGMQAAYKAMIDVIDDEIGKTLRHLESSGLLENTVILFASDHGEMLGDHGRLQKQSYYRQSVQVPCAIRHPQHLDGRFVESPVELTDLAATILDVAGMDPQIELGSKKWPAFHDRVPCRSLMPLVRGETDRARDYAFSECRNDWQMVQDERFKYVRHLNGPDPMRPGESLFDLDSDPQELRSIADDPAAAAELEARRRYCDAVLGRYPPAQLNSVSREP